MLKFSDILKKLNEENSEMTGSEFTAEIEKLIKSYFPNSYVKIKFSTDLGFPSIFGYFALGKDKSEWTNGIIHNDPAHTVFSIYGFDKTGQQLKSLTLNGSIYGYYGKNVKDKAGWRNIKSNGTQSTVLKALDKYFSNLDKLVKSDKSDKSDKTEQ